MKLLSGCQVLGHFSMKKPYKYMSKPTDSTASLAKPNHTKNHSAFLQKFLLIAPNIMKHLTESQDSSARILSKLFNTSNMHLSTICDCVSENRPSSHLPVF